MRKSSGVGEVSSHQLKGRRRCLGLRAGCVQLTPQLTGSTAVATDGVDRDLEQLVQDAFALIRGQFSVGHGGV